MFKFNREEELNRPKEYKVRPFKKDVAIQSVEMITENGEIKSEIREVIIDEAEMISKIPAYTTKIEYMKQYGTLDKMGEIRYKITSPMSENDVLKLRNEILQNGIVEKKINVKQAEEPKNE